jgi:O-antigen/teichoic acid export membrane protein
MDRAEAEFSAERTVDAPPQRRGRTLGDSAVEGVRWMGLARVVADAAAFGASLVLARFIPPAEFGYAAAALGLATIAPNLVTQAFGAPLVQFPTLQRRHVETAMLLSMVTGAVFLLLAPVLSIAAVQPLLGGRIADLFLVATPMFAAAAAAAVPRALIQRALAFRTMAMIEVTALLGGTAVSVLLATLAGLDGEALVLGLVTLHVLTLLLLLFHAPRTWPGWGGKTTATSLVRFGGPVGLSSVLATITASIDYLVLSARMPAASVGFYWRGFMLGVTYPSKISNIMLSVALPLYSRAANADEMRRLRLRVMATHAAILFPLLVTLIVTAPVLVPWLFGPAWEPSVVPTQLLAGAGMVAAVVTGSPAFIIALGRPQYLPAINVIAILGLGSAAYFAAPFGLTGVAAAVLGYYLFMLLVNHYWLLHRVGGIAPRDLFRDAVPPLLGSLPLAAIDLAVLTLLERAGSPAAVTVFVTSSVGLAAYAAVVRVAFPETWRSLRRLAERIVRHRSS